MIAAPAELRIERVPSVVIGQLALSGRLAELAPEIRVFANRRYTRVPTLGEADAFVWMLATRNDWEHSVLAYRDVFDWHTASDVREVCYVGGPATITLLKQLRRETPRERRLIGNIDIQNVRMVRALLALGYAPTRTLFEDLR
jgi:hypothetical protein